MPHARLFGFGVVLAGLASVPRVAAELPTTPTPVNPAPSRVQVAAKSNLITVWHVSWMAGGYAFEVENPTPVESDMELHFKGKTYPFKAKPKGPTGTNSAVVIAPDPDKLAACNVAPFTFNLTGPSADTRIRHVEITGAPLFTATGSTLPGSPNLAPALGVPDKVMLVGAAPRRGYRCGERLEISAAISNMTTITPKALKVELFDVDGTKIGETEAHVKPNESATYLAVSSTTVSGRSGNIRVHLSDATTELAGKLLDRDLNINVQQSGGVQLDTKLVD